MTKNQFNAALQQLGLTRGEFAKLIGVTDRAVRFYSTGPTKVPKTVEKVICLLLSGKIKTKDLENACNKP